MRGLAIGLGAAAVAGVLTYAFWADLAVLTAPARAARASDSALARHANRQFWEVFHAGQYERAPEALELLQAAWYANPDDPVLASHLAWGHLWQLAERNRSPQVPARILEHALLSRHFFGEALALVPGEPRYTGFLSALELASADIGGNEALRRQGYFRGLESIEQWPEFNNFTIAYGMVGTLPPGHERFAEGIEMLWRNNVACGADRKNPQLDEYLAIDPATQPERWTRACANTWIAPYNLEGYLLVFGDALVKSGDWQAGKAMYEQILRTPDAATWPYRELIVARIRDAEANVARFGVPRGRDRSPPPSGMMYDSAYSCMGCHQHSAQSRARHQPPAFVAGTL